MMASGDDSLYDEGPDGQGDGREEGSDEGDELPPYNRILLDDEELAAQFRALVAAAQAKGIAQQDLGFALLSATVEHLLDSGESDCCVMQVLLDFVSPYYENWHDSMSDEAEPWEGEGPVRN